MGIYKSAPRKEAGGTKAKKKLASFTSKKLNTNYYKTAMEIFLSNFFQNVFNFTGEVAPYEEPETNQIGFFIFLALTPYSPFGAAPALALSRALALELAQPHKTREEALLVVNGRTVAQFSSRKK